MPLIKPAVPTEIFTGVSCTPPNPSEALETAAQCSCRASRKFSVEVIAQEPLLKWLGISRTTLYSLQDPDDPKFDPDFPTVSKPFGEKKNYWVVEEISVWLRARIAAGRSPRLVNSSKARGR